MNMKVRVPLMLALWVVGLVGASCTKSEAVSEPGVFAQPIGALAALLEAGYVYPEVGTRYATRLRDNLAQGAYREYVAQADLAMRLTSDLQAVSPDGHLRVVTTEQGPSAGGPPRPEPVSEARWLSEGIAHIRINGFPGDDATVERVDQFMKEHATARVLIIDARTHGGGGTREMNVLLPYLFDQETVLAYMDAPERNLELRCLPPADPTLREVQGPEGIYRRAHLVRPNPDESRLFGAQVFYLTSKRTASAAEHLALALQRTGRATLVGEPTAGANHFSCLRELGDGLAVVLPVGRTVDPDTEQDWEGVGILPDIEVPADDALEEVLARVK
ncbi:S41 family peptidase [Myxococcus sp. K15C18031901]|uniref:S41 family peptidase n=1 Tax=Myxococcus dinghuensis TaxID=2906761 RepID=UPI0020A81ACC|nr:S41 family peptidase [Myxococcus dinghuensis]MCP3097302.1 S41 family peptidase [Myxococcus dinghuensis]